MVSLLWGPTGLRGFAGRLGRAVLSGLAGMPAGKGTKMSLRDMPNARAARDTQAILSADIDWNAPELQNLSASARDFLERLLQVERGSSEKILSFLCKNNSVWHLLLLMMVQVVL